MQQDYTHISFVLDRSGSMESIKSDTIGCRHPVRTRKRTGHSGT